MSDDEQAALQAIRDSGLVAEAEILAAALKDARQARGVVISCDECGHSQMILA